MPTPSFSKYYTRPAANDGIKIEIKNPATGVVEDWIRIRGVDSDAFREADARNQRAVMDALVARIGAGENVAPADAQKEREEIAERSRLSTLASLVISWSFAEDCSQENILALLKDAPQIAAQIDAMATRRDLFLGGKPQPSASLPSPGSDSGSSPKDPP